MSWLRILVATFGFGGALLFGSAFVASYTHQTLVEEMAKDAIRAEVERRVHERVASLDAGWLGAVGGYLARRNATEIAAVRDRLTDSVQAKVARIATEMRNPDCECRKAIAAVAEAPLVRRLDLLSRANERLTVLIRGRYMDVAAKLTREFRIFTAANALVLLFLGIAVVVRRNARLHLLPPALLLLGSAVVVGWFYLFEQDWLHTVLFSDYVGLAYFAWLAAPVLLIGDVVLNRGRISAHLLNAGANAVGATASALPC
jgi:hypothetical protein